MNPKFNRKQWKDGIKKRQQESYSHRDDSGKFKSIFLETIPKSKFWKPTEGEHQINIIPYLAGKHDPKVPEGQQTYLLDIWVFGGIGNNEDNFVALARNYDLPDPIAECQKEMRQDPDHDDDAVKLLSPKRRAIYNVEVLDNPKEQAKGIQLFDASHFSFEKPLTERSKLPLGGGFVYFADADEGQIVSFEAKKGSFTNKATGKVITKLDYVSFQFIPRTTPISDELLQSTHCLDEIIKIPTYDELKAAFYQEPVQDEKTTIQDGKSEPEDVPEPPLPADTCPLDQKFGEDFDNFQECDDCAVRDDCKAKKDEIEEAKKPVPKEKPTPKTAPSPIRRRPGR